MVGVARATWSAPYGFGCRGRNTRRGHGELSTGHRGVYLTATMLAMYRSLQARGASVEQAARLIYLGTASFFDL